MCVLSLSWNFFVSHDKYIKAVEQRATLIHRQYNRDWGTSYSRPPIDPYLTPPPVTKSWRRHWMYGYESASTLRVCVHHQTFASTLPSTPETTHKTHRCSQQPSRAEQTGGILRYLQRLCWSAYITFQLGKEELNYKVSLGRPRELGSTAPHWSQATKCKGLVGWKYGHRCHFCP